MKLASIRLTSKDVPTLRAFYENLTGITAFVHPRFPGYAELRFPGFTLAIGDERATTGASAGANRTAILEWEVDDVDAERARLESLVTEWVMPPTDMPWGNRSMLFRDPEGTLINFYTRLA